MCALKVYRLRSIVNTRDAFVLAFRPLSVSSLPSPSPPREKGGEEEKIKRGKKRRETSLCESDAYASHELDRCTEGLLFEERRNERGGEERYNYTRETRGGERGRAKERGEREEEEEKEGRRSRTLGGSSQSSGWVSTRPVIIGAYLHEHTSNVPNQTSSHVARVGRHCGRVYKARLFLPLPRLKK